MENTSPGLSSNFKCQTCANYNINEYIMKEIIVIFKNNDMREKYFLFGQGFLVASLHTLSHLLQPVHIHTSLPIQAQQDSQGDQEDGHYTRTF